MKRILLTLSFLLGLPLLAASQESYAVAATAPQVTRIDRARLAQNRNTCLARNAVGGATCTQAQACVAYGAAGGAACTVAQARATTPSCEIFAATLAGREAFVVATVVGHVQEFQAQATAEDKVAFCVWWRTVASVAAKNTICTTTVPSLGNGCEICPP
mgnify:CR=1 FL=1